MEYTLPKEQHDINSGVLSVGWSLSELDSSPELHKIPHSGKQSIDFTNEEHSFDFIKFMGSDTEIKQVSINLNSTEKKKNFDCEKFSSNETNQEPQIDIQKELRALGFNVELKLSGKVPIEKSQQAILSLNEGNEISSFRKEKFIDMTPYLHMSQNDAAKKLGIPSSTLSKRWKEATIGRKWPFRILTKINKEIMTLVHNIPHYDQQRMTPELQRTLRELMRRRNEEMTTVVLRL